MTYERIMGICVTDDEKYQRYREGMVPILESFGGFFGFDFRVSEVLISKTDYNINRVFTIEFPSKGTMEEFFSSPEYIEVKNNHFNESVKNITIISMHEKKS